MGKYDILLTVLDKLCQEAPGTYKRYHPPAGDSEKENYARSLAFIHLYLKASYDISNFEERENFITDGSDDAGIDAYYIDVDKKRVLFIQSKFRANEKNFKTKEICMDELLKMQTDRIIDGEDCDENGTPYNGKISKMIQRLQDIPDIARYSYEVILLANLTKYKTSEIARIAGLPVTVINYEVCYSRLLFPVLTGCCYTADEIVVNLSLVNKDREGGRISYSIETEYNQCHVMVVFVPTIEIAKILDRYKNSILKYNPRCYLGLASNEVNPKIEATIRNKKTNEFALFNNGITFLSDETRFSDQVAIKNRAQLIIKNPQIVNGGQTAYTLANLYRRIKDSPSPGETEEMFNDKEVLVKIVTFVSSDTPNGKEKLNLIEDLSRATNQQTQVEDADRHANDEVQIEYQEKIFNDFGYCYNRKRGEFYDAKSNEYISDAQIIDRDVFVRVAATINGKVSLARRSSNRAFYKEQYYNTFFSKGDVYRKYMFGYLCYQYLSELEKTFNNQSNNPHGINTYGNALRYGKYAVINIVSQLYKADVSCSEYKSLAIVAANDVLGKWLDYEKSVSKEAHNAGYFYEVIDEAGKSIRYANYDGYYKGTTVDYDINHYTWFHPATVSS